MTGSSRLLAAAAALIVATILLGFAVGAGWTEAADWQISHSLSLRIDENDPAFIAFMQGASWIGGGTPRWIIVILLCGLVWHWRSALRGRARRRVAALEPRVEPAQARLRPRAARPDRSSRPSDELFIPQRSRDQRRRRLPPPRLARAAALAALCLDPRRRDDRPQRLLPHHARRPLGKRYLGRHDARHRLCVARRLVVGKAEEFSLMHFPLS